jgi:hypothetical protein
VTATDRPAPVSPAPSVTIPAAEYRELTRLVNEVTHLLATATADTLDVAVNKATPMARRASLILAGGGR